jgi:hypothetical protein
MRRTLALAALWASASACGTDRPPPEHVSAPAVSAFERAPIDAPVVGISDVTSDPDGWLWAIPERDRLVVRFRPGTRPTTIPLVGVPDGLDTEGIASLGGGRFAIATESNNERDADLVLLARLDPGGGALRVTGTRSVDYRIWPVHPLANQGLEGICQAGGLLLVAGETAIQEAGRRFAPVGRIDPATGQTSAFRVRLTTSTGKISALSCRATPDAIDVLAIERHFSITRLLRFAVPRGATAGVVTLEPVLVADLAPLIRPSENYEGLIWDGDRTVWLTNDNDYGSISGPNLLVAVRLAAAPPPAPTPPASPASPAR